MGLVGLVIGPVVLTLARELSGSVAARRCFRDYREREITMLSKNMRCELCCFAATCFGLVAFMLTIVALEFSLDGATSQVRLLIAGAGIASLLMILLTGRRRADRPR